MCGTYQLRSLLFHLAGPLLTTSLTGDLAGHVKGVGQQRSYESTTQALHLLGLTCLFSCQNLLISCNIACKPFSLHALPGQQPL